MRTNKVKLLVTAVILSMLLLVTGQALASEPVVVDWIGNGTTDGYCNSLGFYDDLDPGEGQQGWLFILNSPADSTGSELSFSFSDGTSSPLTVAGDQKGNGSYHFIVYTEAGAQLQSASATNGTENSVLTVSHCERVPDPLEISKTANPSYTRTWTWEIDKESDEDYVGFTGDSWIHDYQVTVTPDYTDSGWKVEGVITIYNPNSWGGTVYVSDDTNVAGETCVVANDGVVELDAYETENVGYTCTFSSMPVGEKENKATVDWDIYTYYGYANFTFGEPTSEINPVIGVDDSWYGYLGRANRQEVSWEYSRSFACDRSEGEHVNTATILYAGGVEGASASATVTVDCYALNVRKTANTSFTRTYDWSIDKSANYSSLTLSTGQVFTVSYVVDLTAFFVDSDWAVAGEITVSNPAPIAATLTGVSDYVSGDTPIPAVVDCGVVFPYDLAAGGTLVCTYGADLPNADSRTNSASATLQNTPSGTTNFSGYVDVTFAEAEIEEIDECVTVGDSYAGSTATGEVCHANLPVSFQYTRDISFEVCGNYQVPNTAFIVTNDNGTEESDSWNVAVTVPCPGCTLTQGYWKTHSSFGPAPYDDNWAYRENDPFFLSGLNWYTTFWTSPAGNAYYNLAHQFMAARLNIWNGASSTGDVNLALRMSWNFFNTQSPDVKLTKAQKSDVTSWASTLASYNEGSIGPGHCDE